MGCDQSRNKTVSTIGPPKHAPAKPVVTAQPNKEVVKKVEAEAKQAEAAVIIQKTVTVEAKSTWQNARAQKKFKDLDTDNSGKLEANEIDVLAEWVWCSFNPKQKITPAQRTEEADKIKKACGNKNNEIE